MNNVDVTCTYVYCAHSSTKFCLAKVANETNFPLANKNFH